MLASGRISILRRQATALPFSTGRTITYSARRQPSLNLIYLQHPLRNQPAIGTTVSAFCSWCRRFCGESATADDDNMADSERQLLKNQETSEPKSYGTEEIGASGEDKEKELELPKEPQNGNEQEGSRSMAAENDDTAQGEGGGEECSEVDPVKTAGDHEGGTDVEIHARNGDTVSDIKVVTATKVEANLDEVDQHRLPEQSPKEENEKTPPPEEPEAEPEKVEEGPKGQSQRPSAPAENNPPKQKEGGGGGGLGFFSQLKRGFSSGPKRGKREGGCPVF